MYLPAMIAPDYKLKALEANGASDITGTANVDTKDGTHAEEIGLP